ncbi:Wzz/FepE/Etk N-terminal domain-containing protein [Pseudomonas sp. FSL R10-0765]|uniref:Wzz/FepE/Etk N-terminal domain-containing protein n=1 Tax=unclassified Pseudomonas TaxID=196821 RepID=UPI0015B37F98|nr:Wzz/FepE/Etk N-terminal domain-containing protein [Pseudomonas sp.]
MSNTSSVSSAVSRHNIDIFGIYKLIWQGRRLILLLGTLFGLSAYTYTRLITSEYQVASVLRPVALNALDALNRSGVYTLPPDEALTRVGSALESYGVRLGFFRANQALFSYLQRPGVTLEQSFESFNRASLKVITPPINKVGSTSALIRLELNYPEGVDGAQILNGFVEYAIEVERKHIEADLKIIIENRLVELEDSIDAARAEYDVSKQARIATLLESDGVQRSKLQDELVALRKQLRVGRMDRIAQLKEAIDIAQSLGIQKPTTPSGLAESSRVGEGPTMYTEINNQQIPLYFMGVEILEAERSALLKRNSDDFTEARIAHIAREMWMLQNNREVEVLEKRENEELFLNGVQPFRAEISRLGKAGNLDFSGIQLVAIDRKALEPLSPIKPRKILFVVLGVAFGCAAGALIVLMRDSLAARRF